MWLFRNTLERLLSTRFSNHSQRQAVVILNGQKQCVLCRTVVGNVVENGHDACLSAVCERLGCLFHVLIGHHVMHVMLRVGLPAHLSHHTVIMVRRDVISTS